MSLESVNLFKGLDPAVLGRLEKLITLRDIKKGEIVFMEGDPSDHLFFIIEGEVKIFKEYASGKSAIMGIFGAGSAVAEIAIIDGKPYPATCQAVTDGTVALMKRKDAIDAITTNPNVALRVMRSIGAKLRQLTGDLGSMAVQSVIRRLSRLLLKLADKLAVPSDDTLVMELFLTRKDLADCIGTSFEVAVRGLRKLQEDGILEIEGKRLVIRDIEGLKDIAGAD